MIITALGMTVVYASVCAFFTALTVGMWYGTYRYITENVENLRSKNYTLKEKFFKVLSFAIIICFVAAMTGANITFWARTSSIFMELRGNSNCSCTTG